MQKARALWNVAKMTFLRRPTVTTEDLVTTADELMRHPMTVHRPVCHAIGAVLQTLNLLKV